MSLRLKIGDEYSALPNDILAAVLGKTEGRCIYCQKLLLLYEDGCKAEHPDRFTIDHFKPRSKNGTDALPNLVPSCQDCNNRRKKNKDPYRFLGPHKYYPLCKSLGVKP